MARLALVLLTTLLATTSAPGCHLADNIEPKKCVEGTHYDTGRCLPDPDVGETIQIAITAGACTFTPDAVHVAINGEFSFLNKDTVDHAISGPDGAVWATAPAGRKSPLIGITKAGTYAYSVSGCATKGTVYVE